MLNKHHLEALLREWRPGCDMVWANSKSLLVEECQWPFGGECEPSFALNLSQKQRADPEFDGLHLATRLRSPSTIPWKFVNELNQNFRFARHAIYDESVLGVMLDIAEDSSELTPNIFKKYYTFFSMSVEQLKAAFPVENK